MQLPILDPSSYFEPKECAASSITTIFLFFATLKRSLLPEATPPRCTGIIPLIFLFLFNCCFTLETLKLRFSEFISVKIGFKLLNNIAFAVDTNETAEVIKLVFFFS